MSVFSGKVHTPRSEPSEEAVRNRLQKQRDHLFTFLDHDGGTAVPHYCETIPVSLKTDRVIKSKVASNSARDISAANDPNVMYHIAAAPSDVAAVLDTLTSSP